MKRIRLVNPLKELLIGKGKKIAICTWVMMIIELAFAIFCFRPEWLGAAIVFGVAFCIDVKKFIIDYCWYPEFVDDIDE